MTIADHSFSLFSVVISVIGFLALLGLIVPLVVSSRTSRRKAATWVAHNIEKSVKTQTPDIQNGLATHDNEIQAEAQSIIPADSVTNNESISSSQGSGNPSTSTPIQQSPLIQSSGQTTNPPVDLPSNTSTPPTMHQASFQTSTPQPNTLEDQPVSLSQPTMQEDQPTLLSPSTTLEDQPVPLPQPIPLEDQPTPLPPSNSETIPTEQPGSPSPFVWPLSNNKGLNSRKTQGKMRQPPTGKPSSSPVVPLTPEVSSLPQSRLPSAASQKAPADPGTVATLEASSPVTSVLKTPAPSLKTSQPSSLLQPTVSGITSALKPPQPLTAAPALPVSIPSTTSRSSSTVQTSVPVKTIPAPSTVQTPLPLTTHQALQTPSTLVQASSSAPPVSIPSKVLSAPQTLPPLEASQAVLQPALPLPLPHSPTKPHRVWNISRRTFGVSAVTACGAAIAEGEGGLVSRLFSTFVKPAEEKLPAPVHPPSKISYLAPVETGRTPVAGTLGMSVYFKPNAQPKSKPGDPTIWNALVPVELKRLINSKCQTARVGISWEEVEDITKPGKYAFEKYDPYIKQLRNNQIQPFFQISCSPDIINSNLDQFCQFVSATVTHYKKMGVEEAYWEFVNEPDGKGAGWGQDLEKYAHVCYRAFQKIKLADPSARTILGASSASIHPYVPSQNAMFIDPSNLKKSGYYPQVLDAQFNAFDPQTNRYTQAVTSLLQEPDLLYGVGIHPYRFYTTQRAPNLPISEIKDTLTDLNLKELSQYMPETVMRDSNVLYNFINSPDRKLPRKIPVVISEWGYPESADDSGDSLESIVRESKLPFNAKTLQGFLTARQYLVNLWMGIEQGHDVPMIYYKLNNGHPKPPEKPIQEWGTGEHWGLYGYLDKVEGGKHVENLNPSEQQLQSSENPSFHALQTLFRELGSFYPIRSRLDISKIMGRGWNPETDCILFFQNERGSRAKIAVWTTGKDHRVTLLDSAGSEIRTTLPLNMEPAYLEIPTDHPVFKKN